MCARVCHASTTGSQALRARWGTKPPPAQASQPVRGRAACASLLARPVCPASRPPPQAGAPQIGSTQPQPQTHSLHAVQGQPLALHRIGECASPVTVKGEGCARAAVAQRRALDGSGSTTARRPKRRKEKRLAFACARGSKCASTEKFSPAWRCVFVSSLQAADASGKNALNYDGGVSGFIIYLYALARPISRIDPDGLCSCIAVDGTKDSRKDPTWYGNRRTITCTYKCTRSDGSDENVRGTHTEWYLPGNDNGREGNCLGQQYGPGTYNGQIYYPQTGFGSFDPASSKSPDLQNWAKTRCECAAK